MSEGKNKVCQICKGYLFEDDETVVCPTCGAPHHKDCWETVGHCGVQDDHGTDKQYDKLQKALKDEEPVGEIKKCSMCGRTSKTVGATFCPYCGQPYRSDNGQPKVIFNGMPFKPGFDLNSAIKDDSEIEGVKTSDVAKLTGAMAGRYVPKFKSLTESNKKSWNWAAFLFPSAWSLSRRMYRNGIFFLILAIASSLCFVPFQQTLMSLGDTSELTNRQLAEFIRSNIESFPPIVFIMAVLGILLWIIPRIVAGRYGDWFFRDYTLNRIRKIRQDSEIEDPDFALMKSGAPSLLLMFAALLGETQLPTIIAMFIW